MQLVRFTFQPPAVRWGDTAFREANISYWHLTCEIFRLSVHGRTDL